MSNTSNNSGASAGPVTDLIAPCVERIAAAGVTADGIVDRLPSVRRRVAVNVARAAAARWLRLVREPETSTSDARGSPTAATTGPCPHALQARSLVYESAGCAQSLERVLLQLDGVGAPDAATAEERATLRAHRRSMVLHIQACIAACDATKEVAERGARLVAALLGAGLDRRPAGARVPLPASTLLQVVSPPLKVARPDTPSAPSAAAASRSSEGLSSACCTSQGPHVAPVPLAPGPVPALPRLVRPAPLPPRGPTEPQAPQPEVSPLPLPGSQGASPVGGPRVRCVPCTHSLKWKTARRRQRRQASARSVTPIQWRTVFHQPATVK